MSYWVYIPRCADRSYYTGHTDDLARRIAAHHLGEIPGYTVPRRPIRLEFVEESSTRLDAIARERQIKGWSNPKKEALIHGDWDALSRLARSGGSTSSPRADGGRRSTGSKAELKRIQAGADDYAAGIERADEPAITFNEVAARVKTDSKL